MPKVGHRRADNDDGCWTEEDDNKLNGKIL
jgi:hypothetical protein